MEGGGRSGTGSGTGAGMGWVICSFMFGFTHPHLCGIFIDAGQ